MYKDYNEMITTIALENYNSDGFYMVIIKNVVEEYFSKKIDEENAISTLGRAAVAGTADLDWDVLQKLVPQEAITDVGKQLWKLAKDDWKLV